MKYLITENQKENTLKKFIMSNFDRVEDVLFKKRNVYYGSGPVNGKTKGEETIIIVLIDNLDDELTKQDLSDLKKNIIEKTDKVFDLGYFGYGGGWSFGFRKKVIESF
jgi:hypothetical protein